MKRKQLESTEQAKLFDWSHFMSAKYPILNLMYHVPNGGSRNKIEAANLKRQGVKSGVPDICLPVPCSKFHGLYIEMKVGKNKPTKNQIYYIDSLRLQGYKVEICYSWTKAAEVVCKYLNIKDYLDINY